MPQPILYGIPNCDSVKQARHWLEQNDIDYVFHDFRKDGLQANTLKAWLQTLEWEALLNRRSTSWRDLPPADKNELDQARAIKLMLANPTLIKRPVLVSGQQVLAGFNPSVYQQHLCR